MGAVAAWLCVLVAVTAIAGRAQSGPAVDLSQANLEDLMDLKVTSVSKRAQQLARTPAAVVVVRAEDIRQSGATNLPDVLRMVPGVDVARIDASSWAIGIRGFNSRYSNKVLVLIDGRTVYSPAFSGVYWENLDLPLENIERIEVLRGPGAAVWGANAVNGVISIVTKSSKDTHGGLAVTGGGTETYGLGVAQYGGGAGQSGSYRAFAKDFSIADSAQADGNAAYDHWRRLHGGFRSDWTLGQRDALMVEGDLWVNRANETRWNGTVPTPYDVFFNQRVNANGGNLLARWDHRADGGSESSLQTFYDTYRRADVGAPEAVRTMDVDFQEHAVAGDRNDIVWSLNFRASTDRVSAGYGGQSIATSHTDYLFGTFLQDEIRVADSLWLTLGCKLEHNTTTGFEVEPNLRLEWAPKDSRYTLWASTSRAMREPARLESLIGDAPIASGGRPAGMSSAQPSGNPTVKPEELRDFELGYRRGIAPKVSLDLSSFLSFYRHLETIEPLFSGDAPSAGPPQTQYGSLGHALDYGGELSLNWNVARTWRISPGYAYLHATLGEAAGSRGTVADRVATEFPQNMLTFRSVVNLSPKMEFDQSLYYTARLPGGSIPGRARLDLRFSRRLGEGTELSVVGQNLLRPQTWEYGNSYGLVGTQVERSIYGQVAWRF